MNYRVYVGGAQSDEQTTCWSPLLLPSDPGRNRAIRLGGRYFQQLSYLDSFPPPQSSGALGPEEPQCGLSGLGDQTRTGS